MGAGAGAVKDVVRQPINSGYHRRQAAKQRVRPLACAM